MFAGRRCYRLIDDRFLQEMTAMGDDQGKNAERTEKGAEAGAGSGHNLSTVAAGRMESTETPKAPLSPGAANSGRISKARRKDAT